ncbi:MAG: hypothetical protein ACUVS2_17135 [Candidatus Flexifilum sp.]
MSVQTVQIVPLEPDRRGLIMIWQREVDRADVTAAFRDLMARLDQATQSLYVIVDLRADPRFPLLETFRGALNGPFRHPMLAEWLVVGANSVARSIGSTLVSISGRDNIRWFTTVEEALVYLAAR